MLLVDSVAISEPQMRSKIIFIEASKRQSIVKVSLPPYIMVYIIKYQLLPRITAAIVSIWRPIHSGISILTAIKAR
jgi:hypothetical protein